MAVNQKRCHPDDISLKAIFLGPQGENSPWLTSACDKIFRHWLGWRTSRFPQDGQAISEIDRSSPQFRKRQALVNSKLEVLLKKLEKEAPKFTPRYLGHMTSEISIPAMAGHLAVLLHNPNQTSREVSKAGSQIEKEAIRDLLEMLGMDPGFGRGHFTSGGTLANVEGVWHFLHRLDRTLALELLLRREAPELAPRNTRLTCRSWHWFDQLAGTIPNVHQKLEPYSFLKLGPLSFARLHEEITGFRYQPPLILAAASRHYSWPKAAALLGFGTDSLRKISLDRSGRMSVDALSEALKAAGEEERAVGMVVTIAGSTELGAVDPIEKVQDLLNRHHAKTGNDVWHHVDAAYGGYFCCLLRRTKATSPLMKPSTERSLAAISRAHSITLDPHKLGFVPYSCGAFLARDPAHYRTAQFGAPYLLKDNEGSWMHTIEGSRAGTGAAATWMSNQTIGLDAKGYGRILERGILARQILVNNLQKRKAEVSVVGRPSLNIVCFALARKGDTLRAANARTLAGFEYFRNSKSFSVSKTSLSLPDHLEAVKSALAEKRIILDDSELVCLRLVLMNPFLVTKETNTNFILEFQRHLVGFLVKINKEAACEIS